MITNFHDLRKAAKEQGPKTISVACANDADVLQAVEIARKEGIVEAILVGDKNEIKKVASTVDIDLANYELVDIKDDIQACLRSVELVSMGQAHVVMKGFVDTAVVLKAVLDKKCWVEDWECTESCSSISGTEPLKNSNGNRRGNEYCSRRSS